MAMAGAGFLVAGLILAAAPGWAAPEPDGDPIQVRAYLPLTKEFFEALEKLSRDNATTYGDRQEPLLEQIAVASKFMVKTNLTLGSLGRDFSLLLAGKPRRERSLGRKSVFSHARGQV
ncbi:MAG: hypothetical protein HY743_05975 [Deltaproteobacteria bacterium]|nr:hypothetical protein [Deltaproteobacteria bacterium]